MKKKIESLCPCGSGRQYAVCCGCFHTGELFPATPEALMRSRYSAYVKADIDYIAKTQQDAAAIGFDSSSALTWAKSVKWLRLKVLEVFFDSTDENCGYVKFVAYYLDGGKPQQLTETSQFKRKAGRWFYVGSLPRTNIIGRT